MQHMRYEGPTVALKQEEKELVKLMKMTSKRYQTCRHCLLSDALLKGLKEVLKHTRFLMNMKIAPFHNDISIS